MGQGGQRKFGRISRRKYKQTWILGLMRLRPCLAHPPGGARRRVTSVGPLSARRYPERDLAASRHFERQAGAGELLVAGGDGGAGAAVVVGRDDAGLVAALGRAAEEVAGVQRLEGEAA